MMIRDMNFGVAAMLLLLLPVVHLRQDAKHSPGSCPEYLTKYCKCGLSGRIEDYVQIPVKSCESTMSPGNELDSTFTILCTPCESTEKLCKNYRNCLTCTSTGCATCPAGKEGPFCERDIDNDVSYPLSIKIVPGMTPHHFIDKRGIIPCEVPQHSNTTEIRCTKWPSWIRCLHRCIYGHSFPNTREIRREMTCKTTENLWKPQGFQECIPQMDCTVKLYSPGDLDCTANRFTPTSCNITCYEHENMPTVPSREYSCRGKWIPPLPHCVKRPV